MNKDNIISLIEREKKEYVAIIQINKNFAFALIEDRKILVRVIHNRLILLEKEENNISLKFYY